MSGTWTRCCRVLLLVLLLSNILLITMVGTKIYGDDGCPPVCANANLVDVAPGKDDLKLGSGFPTFGPVKLSYPNSSILTNSVGDLLFSVTLNPLMVNPLSAQVASTVQVWGSGFSSSDTSTCTLSGSPVGSLIPPTCTISDGILTGSFTVANVLAGVYIITGSGSSGDFSSTTFTVLPPSLVLNPSSGPDGISVSVSGFGFYSTDAVCHLIGSPVSAVPPPSCSILGGTLTGTFQVAGPAGSYAIVATTDGADSSEAAAAFDVTASSQRITLTPSFGFVLTPVGVSGLFPLADTACSLSGNIIAAGSSCSILGGILTALFTVGNAAPGVYTITARGTPDGDSARAEFQVLPSSPIAVPNSTLVSLDIYIPPDFAGLTLSNTWTSFTNNYDPHGISVSRQSSSDQIGPNWWKISVKAITVTHTPSSYSTPLVAHAIFVVNQTQYIRLFQVTSPSVAGRYFFKAFINGASIGPQNFPTLVVKAGRDPAYISGTLRELDDRNKTRAGQPIALLNGLGAQVIATGLDYLGETVSAQAFINSTAQGQYTLFGVAPGTYNITAYAAGYIPTTRPTTVNVGPTQSLEGVDIYMTESVNITGTVLSKSAEGSLIPWGNLFGISGQPTNRSISVKLLNLDGSVAASIPPPSSFALTTDGHATSFPFAIQYQVAFDGRIPQNYANFTSGLTSGDYLLYAYVTSYIQLEEVYVHVGNETTTTVSTIPLIRSGTFIVTVHFRNLNSTIGPDILQVDSTLTVSAYDQQGVLRAQNTTSVAAGATSATVELQGFSNSRSFGIASLFSQNNGLLPGTYQIIARVSSSPSFAGFANLGIRDFYYQRTNVQATMGLGDVVVSLSLLVYKAGGLLLSVYSVDDQTPPVNTFWNYPGKTINVMIIGSNGAVYQANSTQPFDSANATFVYVGLLTDAYDVVIQTLGYTQREIIHLNVVLGGNTDAAVWMIENPVIDLTVTFRDEGLLSLINSTQPYAQPINHLDGTPARIEVFDDHGNFVAANVSYIPNFAEDKTLTRTAHFILAGFDRYYGDPRFVWSGFYDTTDGAGQSPGGLILYPWIDSPRWYVVRMWVDGYYQTIPLQVLVPARGNVSAAESLDRATRISGTITGPDFYNIARPLSWAAITLEPNNYTLTGIIDVRPGNYTTFSLDGSFQVWVPGGSYGIGVSLAGYSSYSALLEVPSGSDISMQIWLNDYQPSPVTSALSSSWMLSSNLLGSMDKYDYNATFKR